VVVEHLLVELVELEAEELVELELVMEQME